MSDAGKVDMYELGSEEEREAFDEWMAMALPVEADWEFRNEVQNHMDPGDLVIVRGMQVDIYQRKVLYADPVKDVETVEEGNGAADPYLRMDVLRAMDGDVDRARAAYDWVTGKN